jgi:predicted negative regulator of RcsB-dependent stress response
MSLPEENPKQHALRREWAAARVVIIGGFIVAIAVAGYFAYRQEQATRALTQANAPQAGLAHKVDPKLLARAELAICSAELVQAQGIGIVPTYGQLATPTLVRGDVPRRFICEAGTHLTRYFIAADIRCNNLADARCVSVFRIALKNGALVYQRPD